MRLPTSWRFCIIRRSEALHSANVPGDYPLAKLLTGNAQEGKAFFDGAGGCSKCHSVTGDLRGIAKKYSPIDLQQHMVYPSSKQRQHDRRRDDWMMAQAFKGKVHASR